MSVKQELRRLASLYPDLEQPIREIVATLEADDRRQANLAASLGRIRTTLVKGGEGFIQAAMQQDRAKMKRLAADITFAMGVILVALDSEDAGRMLKRVSQQLR
jgi:ribosomal 50S subunit-associated protein YjgA (DUF615 family)